MPAALMRSVRRRFVGTGTFVGLGLAAFFLANGLSGLIFGRALSRSGVVVKTSANATAFRIGNIMSFVVAALLSYLALHVSAP